MIELLIQRGRPWYKYRDKIIKVLQEFSFSELFNWTPEQTRSIDYTDKMNYLALIKGKSMAKKD